MWKALQTSKIREIGKALPAAGYVSLMTKPTLWGSAEVRPGPSCKPITSIQASRQL